MADEFKIDFARYRVSEPEPLNNTERQLLRDLLSPGLPLWKIMRQLDDYREGLKDSLADPERDLDDEVTRRAYKKVQMTAAAITELFNSIEQSLALIPHGEREDV